MHTCTQCHKEQSWSPFEDGICDTCYDKQFGIIIDDENKPETTFFQELIYFIATILVAALFIVLLFAIMIIQPL